MEITIKNLRLRTVIGMYAWERKTKQDICLNMRMRFDGRTVSQSDNVEDTLNYKTLNKKVIALVEASSFLMLEKLLSAVLDAVMEDPKVIHAFVEIDKPGALRFTESVSVSDSRSR